MTTFLLIRHGHTAWIGRALSGDMEGVALSAEGREQVARLANRIATLTAAAVYSSPLQRTIETAEPIARLQGLSVQLRPRLTEVGVGEWTGRTMADLDKDPRWKQFNTLRSLTRPPGGELMLEVQVRMLDELEELRARHAGQTIAVVSHQDPIKAALAHYMGISLDLFHRFEISPASVSIVQLADWGPRILTVNNTGDLSASPL